ncbi:MAG TPA: CDP-alcohol phosphatidyltransferase family protein [Symbiobacteriaceae bacterium]|jgi:phosphatidylglycerophosphate synthase
MIDTYLRRFVQPVFDQTAATMDRAGATPNQVTVGAFAVGLAAGPLVATGHPFCATGVLWLSGLLDVVDGSLARRTGRSSAWGTTMDIVFDRLVEVGVMLGLAARYPAAGTAMLWLMGAIIFSMTVFLTVGALAEKQGVKSFYYQAGVMERTEGFILFSAMMLLPAYLVPLTWLFVAVESFTGLQRFYEAHQIFSRNDM